jgi:hypothetical protein
MMVEAFLHFERRLAVMAKMDVTSGLPMEPSRSSAQIHKLYSKYGN